MLGSNCEDGSKKNKSGYCNYFIEDNATSGMEEIQYTDKIETHNNNDNDEDDKIPVTDTEHELLDKICDEMR